MSSFARVVLASLIAVPVLSYALVTSAATVTIVKYLNAAPANATTAASASFPFHAIFPGGQGDFTLSPTGFNNANPYQATTADMPLGSNYSVSETAQNTCTSGYPFNIVGYSTGGTLQNAASASPTTTAPNFTNLQADEFVVAWNTTCPPAPALLTPTNGATLTAAQFTSADWSDITDPATPVSYFFESSNSSTVNSTNGSFASPVFQSGALSSSTISTSNTPNGTYYWHVRAQDSAGNYGPWSSIFSFTIVSPTSTPTTTPGTGSINIIKNVIGGSGVFSFTGDGGIGNFSITTQTGGSSQTSTGSTTINNLAPGTYHFTEASSTGWTLLNNTCASVIVYANQTTSCIVVNELAQNTASSTDSVAGTVYNDKYGFARFNRNSQGLSGWTVTLVAQDGTTQTAVTDQNGMYSFPNLPTGWYWIFSQVKWGWVSSANVTPVYVDSDGDTETVNFGEHMFQFPNVSRGHGGLFGGLNNLSQLGLIGLMGLSNTNH